MRNAIIYVTAAIFAAAMVHWFYKLGGPYFEAPETVQDHVAPVTYPSRDAIVLCRRAALLTPRGSLVTVMMPSQAPNYDATLYFTAVGLMPHHRVTNPDLEQANPPDYVISVREPLNHPNYVQIVEFPEGRIYVRR